MSGAALKEVDNELTAVQGDRPLTDTEVQVARSAEMSVFPELFETPSSIASSLAQLAIYRLPDDYYGKYLERLQIAEAAAIAQAMAEVVDPQQNRILVVGDRGVVTEKLTEAGFRNVKYLDTDGSPVE